MNKLLLLFSLFGVSACYFSEEEKQKILDKHNDLRSTIAKGEEFVNHTFMPPATNMRKLTWSKSLEESAQNWSDKCRVRHSGIKGIGENLHYEWSTGILNITGKGVKATGLWQSELQKYGWTPPDVIFEEPSFQRSRQHHLTQTIWATTSSVGCGGTVCGKHAVIVVCHYKPEGNYDGENVYEKGVPCSQCPSGTRCNHEELCELMSPE